MSTVKAVIADAQFLARAGFKQLFDEIEQVEVVGEAATAAQLDTVIALQEPNLVIYDYFNSKHFSLDDLQRIRKAKPDLQFLVVTSDSSKANIFRILQTGVNTILTKHCSREEIINAVHATARKEKFFCNTVLDIILEKQLGKDEKEPNCAPTSLTNREVEIVTLVAQGISTRDMADQLCLSTHTIYTHRKNIMKKLGINSVSELVLYAINSGMVKPNN